MQDMIHCLNPSILERHRAQLQWQQQQQKQEVNNNFCIESFFSLQSEGLGDGWPNLNATSSPYPIAIREKEEMSTTITNATISNSTSSVQVGKMEKSSNKRKVDKSPMGSSDEEEKKKKRTKEDSGNSLKEKNEDNKPDYIHVRARRGQATDSHSLAERVRRERISERMKYLQGLVPGCDKITGKAGMLDEIINYVQSLQRQVEFLSMKLAAVNPRLDHINMETLFTKEINIPCNSNISSVAMSSELVDPTFIQFNSLLDMAMNQTEPFLDSCFSVQRDNAGWDTELHNPYVTALPFHSLQGNLLPNNLKRGC